MKKDLTMSAVDRQNILNNKIAIENIQEYIGVSGMFFKGEYRFTKSQVSDFYGVDISTIERYLSSNEEELKHNGYENLELKAKIANEVGKLPVEIIFEKDGSNLGVTK